MAFLNIKDTRLSTWLKKYNAKEKKAVDEANKVIAAQAKALKKKNLPKGLVDVSTGNLATTKLTYTPINLPSEYLPLKVVQSSGVEVTPRVNINVTDLNKKGSVLYKHFYNNTGHNDITFKVDVIIKRNERWKCALYTMYKGKSINDIKSWAVTTVLKEWIRNSVPLYIVSSAIDIPDGNYVITGNPTRKQTYDGTTTWTLEFTTFDPLNLAVYKNNNVAIKKALAKQKNAKSNSSKNAKFKKCKLSALKYSKKKKTVTCVKYMQAILYKKGCLKTKSQIDGWYGKVTAGAVTQFQKKYKKKYKLKVTSGTKVDKATFNAMCKV